MIVGTAGHIDHGKTSLVKALTGIDTDRLEEEKRRGITIDLGFAYAQLPGGGVLGFVDVPGHERLVHTMIAGAASIDLALLVVAADDGVMPQTQEHLQILGLLGIRDVIVAMTKVDLADADRRLEVELEVHALLEAASLAAAAVVPVSVATGEGVDGLREILVRAARDRASRAASGAFRLAVDRCFSLAGLGTVVTGSVLGGRVAVGDSVLLLPGGRTAKVRSLHAQNRPARQGLAGERCALNLQGQGIHKDTLGRGDWVVDPAQHGMTSRFDAELHVLPTAGTGLRAWSPVQLHHGAGQVDARVVPLEDSTLPPGRIALTQLVLSQPRPMRHDDRLVLRDAGTNRTIAGGRVLDPGAPERRRRTPQRMALLGALRAATPGEALAGRLALPPFLVNLDGFAMDHALTGAEAARLAAEPGCSLLQAGPWLAGAAALAQLRRETQEALAAFHARTPDSPGMTVEALRLAMPTRVPRDAFATLVAHWRQAGVVAQDSHLVRTPDHAPGLTVDQARLWRRVEALLAREASRPPRLREIAAALSMSDVVLRRACKGFARTGRLVEVSPDQFFLRSALPAMAQAAEALSIGSQAFSAAQFRDRLGIGRTLAIEVLEYFDRRGLTLRRGDLRRTVKPAAAIFGTPEEPR